MITCEVCHRKATWLVATKAGRAAERCGYHNKGKYLQLFMRRIKPVKPIKRKQ